MLNQWRQEHFLSQFLGVLTPPRTVDRVEEVRSGTLFNLLFVPIHFHLILLSVLVSGEKKGRALRRLYPLRFEAAAFTPDILCT